jgi:hypothetical protein
MEEGARGILWSKVRRRVLEVKPSIGFSVFILKAFSK